MKGIKIFIRDFLLLADTMLGFLTAAIFICIVAAAITLPIMLLIKWIF